MLLVFLFLVPAAARLRSRRHHRTATVAATHIRSQPQRFGSLFKGFPSLRPSGAAVRGGRQAALHVGTAYVVKDGQHATGGETSGVKPDLSAADALAGEVGEFRTLRRRFHLSGIEALRVKRRASTSTGRTASCTSALWFAEPTERKS